MINEIINLSLSNGATLGEGEQVVNLPNEFIEQFNTGQAKEIDTAICAKTDGCNEARWFSLTTRNVNDGQIQGVINKLWGVDTNYKSVSKFHVFHPRYRRAGLDVHSLWVYGLRCATGYLPHR